MLPYWGQAPAGCSGLCFHFWKLQASELRSVVALDNTSREVLPSGPDEGLKFMLPADPIIACRSHPLVIASRCLLHRLAVELPAGIRSVTHELLVVG